MADIFTQEKRSRIMAAVKGKDTQIELQVRKELHKRGLRYRLHIKELPGKPDLVFPRYKVALFVNGCFWHGHANCQKASLPSSNIEFWEKKIRRNRERDIASITKLQELGWRCLVLWECQLDRNEIDWDSLTTEILEHSFSS
ncbi:MAG: DNA mismatch endonuclease Vsr [Deltaproteobacteria bacterium]|nr:DNA mismatch endonuclease Vsr [Deltaproteobacteria bacterium]